MSTLGDTVQVVEVTGKILSWVVQTIVAFVRGDDSPDVHKLIDVLPTHYKADLAHARQTESLRRELADFEAGKTK